MISKDLITKLFDATSILRWNDKLKPIDFCELDKQAHKMIIAYVLAKLEEETQEIDWMELIEGGLFEFLHRIVITDLKPQIFYKIKKNQDQYLKLNNWVCEQLEPLIKNITGDFSNRFKSYIMSDQRSVAKDILSAAHFYATKWEFEFIQRSNPNGYEISEIRKEIEIQQEEYYHLNSIRDLNLYSRFRTFVELCGELRFHTRWGRSPRIPRTSVLGHMLFVAIITYLCSLEIGACNKRKFNNYFTGLFHDFPEVLTRDVISPIKHSVTGLDTLIKQYEKEEMEKHVYSLLKTEWHDEIRMFTESEFSNIVSINGEIRNVSSDEINDKYNKDSYNPRDGELVNAVDQLAAFIEAYTSIRTGIRNPELIDAVTHYKEKSIHHSVAGIDFEKIYASFPESTIV